MMRHMRSSMKIRWQDKVTNIKVLKRAGLPSMEDLFIRKNLRCTGHLLRMPTDRLPRQVLYSQLPDGQRPRGHPRLRYKDTIKRHNLIPSLTSLSPLSTLSSPASPLSPPLPPFSHLTPLFLSPSLTPLSPPCPPLCISSLTSPSSSIRDERGMRGEMVREEEGEVREESQRAREMGQGGRKTNQTVFLLLPGW